MRTLVAGAIVIAATIACKNERTDQPYASAPPPAQTSAATTEETAQATATPPAFNPPNEYAPDVVVLGVDTTVLPGSAKPAPPPDPFAPVVESVRASALSCFSPLPPGTYASTIVVKVTPAGTPIDVQIDPGNVQAPAVLDCLRHAGEGRTYPSSPDGRTVSIYVRVAG